MKAFFDADEFDDKIFENVFSTEQLIRGCFTKLVNIPEIGEDDEENEAFECMCRLRAFLFYLCHRIYLNIPRHRPIAKSFLGAVIRRATIVHNVDSAETDLMFTRPYLVCSYVWSLSVVSVCL